jgi:hypothetical protein
LHRCTLVPADEYLFGFLLLTSTLYFQLGSGSGLDVIKYPTCSNTCPLCVIALRHFKTKMQPVKSTAEILAFKVLNRNTNIAWVDWALDMMTAGFDTEHLRILAGEREPFNQFQMQDLTNKVLNELNLDYADKNKILNNYVCYFIDKALSDETQTLKVLNSLKDLCIELDYKRFLYDFYLLYFAKQDLIDSENQWYWDGADRSNIDNIIKEYFTKFKSNCVTEKTTNAQQ